MSGACTLCSALCKRRRDSGTRAMDRGTLEKGTAWQTANVPNERFQGNQGCLNTIDSGSTNGSGWGAGCDSSASLSAGPPSQAHFLVSAGKWETIKEAPYQELSSMSLGRQWQLAWWRPWSSPSSRAGVEEISWKHLNWQVSLGPSRKRALSKCWCTLFSGWEGPWPFQFSSDLLPLNIHTLAARHLCTLPAPLTEAKMTPLSWTVCLYLLGQASNVVKGSSFRDWTRRSHEYVRGLLLKKLSHKPHHFPPTPNTQEAKSTDTTWGLGEHFPALREFTVWPQKNPFASLSFNFLNYDMRQLLSDLWVSPGPLRSRWQEGVVQ